MRLLFWIGWGLTGLYGKLWHGIVYEGSVPRDGGVLLLANHASFLDPPLVGFGSGRFCTFMARASLFRFGPFGRLLRAVGAFPVERGAADRRSLEAAIDELRRGHVLVLFPEGTRSRDGDLGEFKRGVELLARRAGVPVVPAAIVGSGRALPRGRLLPRPCRIRVRYGEAIAPEAVAAHGVAGLRAAVQALLGPAQAPTAAENPGPRVPPEGLPG